MGEYKNYKLCYNRYWGVQIPGSTYYSLYRRAAVADSRVLREDERRWSVDAWLRRVDKKHGPCRSICPLTNRLHTDCCL